MEHTVLYWLNTVMKMSCREMYLRILAHLSFYVSLSPLALSLFKHLQIHAERLLNGVFGDEVDEVLDVSLSVGC